MCTGAGCEESRGRGMEERMYELGGDAERGGAKCGIGGAHSIFAGFALSLCAALSLALAARGGGGIPAWLEWKMVGAVVALGRVALSLHVYQGRRRACRAVVAWSATGESSCRCVSGVSLSSRHGQH